jgi:hypothetical protein
MGLYWDVGYYNCADGGYGGMGELCELVTNSGGLTFILKLVDSIEFVREGGGVTEEYAHSSLIAVHKFTSTS